MRSWLGLWLAVAGVALGAPMPETLEPENVAVVVNDESWASQTVAAAYVRLRGIPERNVIVLSGLPHFETITVDGFRQQILTPVLAAIRERGLQDAIDCIAYSADIPYEVDFHAEAAGQPLGRHAGDRGSLTGLTYLHEAVLAGEPRAYTALDSNRYARRVFVDPEPPPLSAEDVAAWRAVGQLLRQKRNREAIAAISVLCAQHPEWAFAHYDLACCLTTEGETGAALVTLERAAKAGWWNTGHADEDPDLKPLRELPAYAEIRERMERNRRNLSLQPTRRFRAPTAWAADGLPAANGDGSRYLLAVMLGVTSGRGNSVREAVAALERAAAADGTRPSGTVYYLVNGDVRSRTRQWGFAAAARLLQAEGVAAVIADGVLPQQRADLAGVMAGSADFDFPASGSRILPGAICEHLTSAGGVLTWSQFQTPLTEFLRHGAAGASGTVTEPLAIQAKFPDPFIHVHYVRGASLAEAFYQSVAAPYQLLIVGDPLCRPWGQPRKVKAVPAAVTAGAELKPAAAVKPETWRRGLRVVGAPGVCVVSGVDADRAWWQTAGIARGAAVTVEGAVEARTNDLYQFQVLSAGGARVTVDGQVLPATGRGHWQMFPVALAAGWHAVSLQLTAGGGGGAPWAGAPLELRFGAAGVRPLEQVSRCEPRRGDTIRNVGVRLRLRLDAAAANPLDARIGFGLEGLEGLADGRLTMAWETATGSGWTVEPARATVPLARGACEPVAFRVRYAGDAFVAPGFFPQPLCVFALERDVGPEQLAPQALPLGFIREAPPRPRLAVPRAVAPPKIDGVLDDAAWAGAPAVSCLLRPPLDQPPAQPTAVWLAWDDTRLYAAFRCTEPELARLCLKSRYRDESVNLDDSIEFFVNATADDRAYRQFLSNAAGVVRDSIGWDARWNGEFALATGRTAEAWTVELAIPWATLDAQPPAAGATIRVLVARNRIVAALPELSTWPPAPGGNHQPKFFAEAVLQAAPAK